MYKFLIFLLLAVPFSLHAFDVPIRPTGFVQDYGGILTTPQIENLEAKLQVFEQNTTNEIAIVTIPSLDGDVIENVAQEIFSKWSIGKKDKNNGVLFLISLSDRKTRIQTGYGVEGDLTDLGTSYIQEDLIKPTFQSGDYYVGINAAVDKMIEALGGSNIVPKDYSITSKSPFSLPFNLIIFFVIIVFQILAAILGRSKSWWHGGVLGGGVSLIIWHFFIASLLTAIPVIFLFIGFGLLFDFIVSRAYTQKQNSGRYPWWFGGGGGGFGGSGGGFGGWGGGSSGGGGSSSSW